MLRRQTPSALAAASPLTVALTATWALGRPFQKRNNREQATEAAAAGARPP